MSRAKRKKKTGRDSFCVVVGHLGDCCCILPAPRNRVVCPPIGAGQQQTRDGDGRLYRTSNAGGDLLRDKDTQSAIFQDYNE